MTLHQRFVARQGPRRILLFHRAPRKLNLTQGFEIHEDVGLHYDRRVRRQLDVTRRLEGGRRVGELERVTGGVARVGHGLKTVRGGDDGSADGHPLSVHRTVPDSEVRILDVQEVVRTVD